MGDPSLAGSVAVVTGASRGIGRAIALDLARAGADVVVGLRTADGNADVVGEIESLGRTALPLVLDVLDLGSCREQLDSIAAALGGVDILVNNAGGSIVGNALDVTEEDFATVWELNVRSTFFVSQYVTRRFFEERGDHRQRCVASRNRRAARRIRVLRQQGSGHSPHQVSCDRVGWAWSSCQRRRADVHRDRRNRPSAFRSPIPR